MKKITNSLMVVTLLAGSLASAPIVSANNSLQPELIPKNEVTDFSGLIFTENGKDNIVSPPVATPGKISTMVYANFEKTGEYILYNNQNINLYTKPNGAMSGAISPQMVLSKERKGQWFKINTWLGERWILNDDEDVVELRDLDEKNALLTVKETVFFHSQPFSKYRIQETLAPTTVKVLKQAGNWYLIDYASRKLWIKTEKASYVNGVETFNTTSIYGVPYKKMIVPNINKSVRPAFTLKPGYITVHNTANTAAGANATMHANYLLTQAATNKEAWKSWHFTVDDKQIIQHLPLNEVGFHAGDNEGPGNRSSIGIEIAENKDGNYAKAEENAKKLIAYLIDELNIPMDRVKGHINWSGKYCPRVILDKGWGQFMTSLKQVYDSQRKNKPAKLPFNRVITGNFIGEAKVKKELETLTKQTGWWATTKPLEQTTPYYHIVTGEYTGETAVKNVMADIQAKTGYWMYYEKTRPAYYNYRVVTGGFRGLATVQKALNDLKRDTGWWATYRLMSAPDLYQIVTGGFGPEAKAKEALKLVNARGWWATTEQFGEPVYYYRIRTGNFLGEANVIQGVAKFTELGLSTQYHLSGREERHYAILTGGFGSLPWAEQQAQWIRDTFGWPAITE